MKNFFTFSGPMIMWLQIIAAIISVCSAPFVSFTVANITITIAFFYLFSAIGVSMMLHRYWAHRTFEFKYNIVKWLFTYISLISTRGSPLAWVHIHRQHHASPDTDRDPHRPATFRILSFKSTYITELKIFLIKDLMRKDHKIFHEYYLLFIISWVIILALISPHLVVFAWALPVFINQISQDLWNFFSHIDVGYRNFATNDNSRNVLLLWPLILGEAWHNNHHYNARLTTKYRWWEFDPINTLIDIVKK